MLVSYSDIGQFQSCPLLFTKFRTFSERHTREFDDSFVESSLYRIMVKSAENGQVPTFGQFSPVIGKEIKELEIAGIPKKTINSLLLLVRGGIDEYKTKMFNLGYRPVAFDFDIHQGYGKITYRATIPALMMTQGKELIPVYSRYDVPVPTKNNYIRFNAAVVEEMTGFKVHSCMLISVNSKSVDIDRHYFKHGEINRAGKELINILRQMGDTQQTPNTNHCHECPMSRRCKL
jgi:hypothetical protein